MVYKLSPNIVKKKDPSSKKTLLLNMKNGDIFSINENMSTLLKLLEKETSAAKALEKLPKEAREDALVAIKKLKEQKILCDDNG